MHLNSLSLSLEEKLSHARIHLINAAPFFATLALHTDLRASRDHPTAWTNGRDIFFNPDFADTLSPAAFTTVLLHEILHCALNHVGRCGRRDALIWNIAADIVVNGFLVDNGQLCEELPLIHQPEFAGFATEQVYDALLAQGCKLSILSHPFPQGDLHLPDGLQTSRRKPLPKEWSHALRKASVFASSLQGHVPGDIARIIDQPAAPSVDWRHAMARFVTHAPVDYCSFDRRFIHQGIYRDAMGGLSARIAVCIDTSGSIGTDAFNRFVAELTGIIACYEGIRCELYFADCKLSGPYSLQAGDRLPEAHGGGGTSFEPFFEAITQAAETPVDAAVYLTDGYGTFPSQPPPLPVLWVVTHDGMESKEFPFGEILRMPAQ